MANQVESDRMFMDWAWRVSERSHAVRLQVGCVIEKDDSVISYGWNGMPAGFPNRCEHEVLIPSAEEDEVGNPLYMHLALKTNDEVSHAELNACGKLCASTVSAIGSRMYSTHSPCLNCARLIQRTGIIEVVYDNEFRTDEGIYLLRKRNIVVREI